MSETRNAICVTMLLCLIGCLSDALARSTVDALGAGCACLLANHGQITLGSTPGQALKVAQEVEELVRATAHKILDRTASQPGEHPYFIRAWF